MNTAFGHRQPQTCSVQCAAPAENAPSGCYVMLYCPLALVRLSGLLQGYMPCLTSLLIVYALRVPHCPLIDPVHPERRGPAYTPFPLGYPRPTGLPPRRSVPLDSDWLFLPVPNLAGISTLPSIGCPLAPTHTKYSPQLNVHCLNTCTI